MRNVKLPEILAFIAAVFLSALCSVFTVGAAEDRASRYYEDGLSRFEKRDTAGAIIQLKNALQEDPKLLSAYLLIGKAYLQNAQPANAQDSLEKALRYGADASEVTLPLAQALLDQGKTREVLDRFFADSLAGERRADLLVIRGRAQALDGDLDGAGRSFEEARSVNPRSISAILALADHSLQRGKPAEAARLIDQALAMAPEEANAWYLKALIQHGAGDKATALEAYDRALALSPTLTDARVARASLLLDLDRLDAVAADVDYFRRENPKESRGNYLRAVYLARKGDANGARAALTEVAQLLDPVPIDTLKTRAPQMLLLGGLAHHGLGNGQKARLYLEQYLRVQPGQVGARKVLGSTLIDLRDFVTAINVLEPARKMAPKDPQVLALLASAHMMRGQSREATRFLEEALASGESSPGVHATLGFSLLKTGQQHAGVQQLQTAFEKDPTLEGAGFALTVHYIRRGDTKRALEISARLAERYPNNPAVINMLGIARGASGDLSGARAAYEKAIQIDRTFTPARLNLGKLDLQEGKRDAARERFLAIFKDRPKDTQAMYELAMVEEASGRSQEAIRWLEKLRGTDQRNVQGAVYLTDAYLRSNELRKALEVVRGVEPFAPENLEVLAVLGRALIANKDEKGAQIVLAKMTRLAENDPGSQYLIARLQVNANNLQGATYSLGKALAANPEFLPAKVLLADIDIMRGQLDAAEAQAKAIIRSNPGEAAGYRLTGDVGIRRAQPAEALNAYKTALAKEATTENAVRLYQAYSQSGSPAKATELMESWVKTHPADWVAMRALAESHLRAGNLRAARESYEAVIRGQGEDAGLLNNLADIIARQGDPKTALELAERAHRLAPTNALVQDTLGWLLVRQGNMETGLKHLREARLRDPRNPDIRYHLSAALARLGRRDEAREELAPTLNQSRAFESAREAKALAHELSLQ